MGCSVITDQEVRSVLLAMSSLPSFGASRLKRVLEAGDPLVDWERLLAGEVPDHIAATDVMRRQWRDQARRIDPLALAAKHEAAGVTVSIDGDEHHPVSRSVDPSTGNDPYMPPLLFWRGDDASGLRPEQPRVGIIGTRRASRYGFDIAREFGRELAHLGITVVSGLASGIDAAGHRGALDSGATPVVAVIGCGLDVVYPKSNRQLYGDVASGGVVLSEYPLGTEPASWRFPARNRILAALSHVLVVVESHDSGGSLITAGIAGGWGIPVLAVPGAIRSEGSRGANKLIADGCQPCLGVDDILDALTLVGLNVDSSPKPPSVEKGLGREDELGERERTVLTAIGWERCSLDQILGGCAEVGMGGVATALAVLQQRGIVTNTDGLYEQLSHSDRLSPR